MVATLPELRFLMGNDPEMSSLAIINLYNEPIYSRPIVELAIKRMVNNWDSQLAGVLIVSLRSDGKYYILDGNHRKTAASKLGISHLACLVLTGLTLKREAEIFNRINDRRVKLNIGDLFKSEVAYGDPVALGILYTVEYECGLTLNTGGKSSIGGVALTKALYRMWHQYGQDNLKLTLNVIMATWPEDKLALSSRFMAGLSSFLAIYNEIPASAIQNKFVRINPARVIGDALASSVGNSNNMTICKSLVDYYNKGKSSGRLDPNRIPTGKGSGLLQWHKSR